MKILNQLKKIIYLQKIKFIKIPKIRYEGKIEPLNNIKPFYMVFVENGNVPSKKHENYQDALNECLRLSKKENKTAYVLIVVTQVEQISNVKQFNLKIKNNE